MCGDNNAETRDGEGESFYEVAWRTCNDLFSVCKRTTKYFSVAMTKRLTVIDTYSDGAVVESIYVKYFRDEERKRIDGDSGLYIKTGKNIVNVN